ncbi:MAG: C25 family cysteine peptidase, partial [Anaerolineae bacterium]
MNAWLKRNLLFCALVVLVGFSLAFTPPEEVAACSRGGEPRWLPFTPGASPGEPSLIVTAGSPTEIDLLARIPGIWVEEVNLNGQSYTRLTGEGFGHGARIGGPDLPVLRRSVEIPFGAQMQLEVIQTQATETNLAALGLRSPILPLQPPVSKCTSGQGTPPVVRDAALYETDAFFPDRVAVTTREYIVRGHRALAVEIWPVAYNPVTGQLRLYSEVRLRLRLTGSDMERTQTLARRYASSAFEGWLSGHLLNYNQGRRDLYDLGKTPVGYLIIAADAYYSAMAPFVTLKQNQGYTVTIVRTSEIPGGATASNIQAYIQNAYHHWPVPPSFVLLVGDTDTIPTWTGPTISTSTDLYYGTMDASGTGEWHPDIGVGRFPVRSVAQATAVVNKYLAYAQLTGEEPWLKKASFPASCDSSYYHIAEGTHNYVISTHTQPRGYTGTFPNNPQPGGDKLYCITYNAGYSDLTNAFNQGRWAIIYSGHGNYSGWEMSFDSNAVRNLTNYGMFPFVASHACLTGNFGQTEVFGETWVLQENKGALAYWGSSTYSYWSEDDVLERRAFDALFGSEYPDVPLSAMAHSGLAGVETSYPSMARYYWETYNVLGDPSLTLFPSHPLPPQLTIAKSVETATVEAGTRLRYTLVVTNTGGPADGVVVTDTLPAGTLFAGASNSGTLIGNDVVWSGLQIEAGRAITLSLDVTVTCVASGTHIVNDAYTVTAAEWPTPTTGLPVTVTATTEGVIADFSFSPSPAAQNGPVGFINLSRNATAYLWDFGDGATSSEVEPSHTYGAVGTYTVVLTATNFCDMAVVSRELSVENYAVALVPDAAAKGGDPGQVV